MKYIVQCPLCGEQELEYNPKRDEFWCSNCEDTFDREEIHIKVIEERDIKHLLQE